MNLIPANTKINFVGQTRFCTPLSLVLMALSVLGFMLFGFNLGIDFRGGTQLQIVIPAEASGEVGTARVRDAFARAGFGEAEITRFGADDSREYLVRLSVSEEEVSGAIAPGPAAATPGAAAAEPAVNGTESTDSSGVPVDDADGPDERPGAAAGEAGATQPPAIPPADAGASTEPPAASGDAAAAGQPSAAPPGAAAAEGGTSAAESTEPAPLGSSLLEDVQAALTAEFGVPAQFESIETIGPRVGREITVSALQAIIVTSLLILAYIWLRFDLRYAPGAVAALLHDVMIVIGVFTWFQIEFTQQIVAALLVILGYSINDTVVIYDRIRENVAVRGKTLLADVVNESLNQTLSRTILTTGFTLIVVVALLVFGGTVLRGFALALFIGMLSGVYSTVYVASAMLIWLERRASAKAVAAA
jgi:preprotein translocase SecF subunit